MNVSSLLLGCLEGVGREKEKEGGGCVTQCEFALEERFHQGYKCRGEN